MKSNLTENLQWCIKIVKIILLLKIILYLPNQPCYRHNEYYKYLRIMCGYEINLTHTHIYRWPKTGCAADNWLNIAYIRHRIMVQLIPRKFAKGIDGFELQHPQD
jgi:hypothetical protein